MESLPIKPASTEEIENSVREYYKTWAPDALETERLACINQWGEMEKAGWVITQEEDKHLSFVTPMLTFYKGSISAQSRYKLTHPDDFGPYRAKALDKKNWPKDHPHVFETGRVCSYHTAYPNPYLGITNPLVLAEIIASVLSGEVGDGYAYSMNGFGENQRKCAWCCQKSPGEEMTYQKGYYYHPSCLRAKENE